MGYQSIDPNYAEIEFSLPDGQTDYDLSSNQARFATAFGVPAYPYMPTYVQIRTNNTISVKLNSTGDDAITIASTDSPFVINGVRINNMFFSNSSGSAAAVKLFLRKQGAGV